MENPRREVCPDCGRGLYPEIDPVCPWCATEAERIRHGRIIHTEGAFLGRSCRMDITVDWDADDRRMLAYVTLWATERPQPEPIIELKPGLDGVPHAERTWRQVGWPPGLRNVHIMRDPADTPTVVSTPLPTVSPEPTRQT